MRAFRGFLTGVIVVEAGLLAIGATKQPSAAGDWDAVIRDPQRPWNFLVHLEPVGARWSGVFRIEGYGELPLSDVRLEAKRVRFRFPPELDSLAFDGTMARDTILGQVSMSGRATPVRLTRVVPMKPPADRLGAWRQDIDYAASRLSEYDRSFSPQARAAFRQSLDQLKLDLPKLNDAQIVVALSRAVALADNGHTRLRLDPTSGGLFTTEFPLRFWSFSDGPYVIRAAYAYPRALRSRLTAIEGNDIAHVQAEVARLLGGNEAWAAYLAPIYMTSPDILFGLGVIPSAQQATFTFEDAHGRFDQVVRATPIDRDASVSESWQELSPMLPSGNPPLRTALAARRDRLPLDLQHPERVYGFEFEPESGLLYFQYNRADNEPDGPSFEQFGDSLVAFVHSHTVRKMVVDLRFNSGGNLQVAKTFFQNLANSTQINGRGRLFVITGHCTFSAGLYHAAQLRQLTDATFVREPVGDRLDYWAEGGRLVLPNSRVAVDYANGFHRYSKTDYAANQPYYESLSIASLAPDISTPTTSADYFAGRDPVLEAIEAGALGSRH